MLGAGGQALGPATMQRGSGSNQKSHTNLGESDRAGRARLVGGDYGNDASVTDPDGSALRGKPTKDQKTFNESRSNSTRTTSPLVNNGTGRTLGGAATADDAAAQGAGTANTPKSNL